MNDRTTLILESTTEGFWDLDLGTGRVSLGPTGCELTGFSPDGAPCDSSFLKRLVHPDDQPRIFPLIDELFRGTRRRHDLEFRVITEDGTRRWIENRARVVAVDAQGRPLRMVGIIIDISAQKLLEEQLKASEERFRSVMELSPDIISIVTADGTLAYNSPSAERIHGYTVEEITGRNTFDLIHPDDRPRVAEALAAVLRNLPQPQSVEYRYRNRDGSYSWMEATASNQLANPHIRGVVAVARDITDRVAAREAADAANRAKSEFLANMSHEIRTPLHVIMGMAQLIKETDVTGQQARYLDTLSRAADGLLSLVSEILDFSKIETDKLELERRGFSLRACLDDIIRTKISLAHGKGLRMETDIPDEVPDRLLGDQLRLRQILLNLVGNAIKFTEQGEIRIRVGVTGTDERGVLLEIEVSDTGIGISPEALEKIFEPFVQADSSTTRKYGGTGLGLAICTRLATLMGGSIRAESRAGREQLLPHLPQPPERGAGHPSEQGRALPHPPRGR